MNYNVIQGMKSLKKSVPIVGALVALTVASPPLGKLYAQNRVEQELMQIENDWCKAELSRDKAMFARIMADDYVGVTSGGLIETKAEAIAELGTNVVNTCVNSNLKVRVYKDAAVVNGLATRNAPQLGAAYRNRKVLFTDTFVRRDGRWQCVASQATLVAAQQKG